MGNFHTMDSVVLRPAMRSFQYPLPALVWLLFLPAAPGQSVFSPAVGFVKTVCPGGKDTVLSVPFHPTPKWSGFLGGPPQAVSSTISRLTFSGTTDFTPGLLMTPRHLVFFGEAGETTGRHFAVASHTASTVDIAATIDELNTVSAGTSVDNIPCWTLETILPPSTQTAIHLSSGNLASQRGSELLLFDPAPPGINPATTRRFFLVSSGWVEAGTYASAGAVELNPGQLFVIRHRPGAEDTIFLTSQQVYRGDVTFPVSTGTTSPRDTPIGLPRPIPTKVADLDLEQVVETSAGTAPEDRRDELRVFDRLSQDGSRRPVAIYFRVANEWRRDASGFPPGGNDLIEPSAGLIIRKAPPRDGNPVLWINSPRYDVSAP